MAGIADVAGIDMRTTLAAGAGMHAVVTTDTGFTGGTVVEYGHQPIARDVAGVALQHSGNMVGALAAGNHAIVATTASADDLVMIDRTVDHRQPGRKLCRRMAGITDIGGINVR